MEKVNMKSLGLFLFFSVPHTCTCIHTQCDKFSSVTHTGVPIAAVRGSADQTLRGALLQIQASSQVVVLCSASPGEHQAGCCGKGNCAVSAHKISGVDCMNPLWFVALMKLWGSDGEYRENNGKVFFFFKSATLFYPSSLFFPAQPA